MSEAVALAGLRRIWDAGRPVDVLRTLSPLVRGTGDPAHRVVAGRFWWAARTPDGPGTLALSVRGSVVEASAWGAGAAWLLDGVPRLLGAEDDWSALSFPHHPVLADTVRRFAGLRLPATGLVLDSLVPAILEQRVTGREARRAWRLLLQWYGEPAPGPLAGLRVPPDAATLLAIPSWDWHRLGVDLQRSRAVRAVATVAVRLEECCFLSIEEAVRRLSSVPGVGVWTVAETLQRAVGAPDQVSVGDYHIHDLVVCALTGRPRGTDEEMVALLEPWAGQRQRVVRVIEMSPVTKPRFGPRYQPVDIRSL